MHDKKRANDSYRLSGANICVARPSLAIWHNKRLVKLAKFGVTENKCGYLEFNDWRNKTSVSMDDTCGSVL